MDRLPDTLPPVSGKLRPDQIAQRGTWAGIPDDQVATSAMQIIHVVPSNGTTVTTVNPLDPGTISAPTDDGTADTLGWLDRPAARGTVMQAGRP